MLSFFEFSQLIDEKKSVLNEALSDDAKAKLAGLLAKSRSGATGKPVQMEPPLPEPSGTSGPTAAPGDALSRLQDKLAKISQATSQIAAPPAAAPAAPNTGATGSGPAASASTPASGTSAASKPAGKKDRFGLDKVDVNDPRFKKYKAGEAQSRQMQRFAGGSRDAQSSAGKADAIDNFNNMLGSPTYNLLTRLELKSRGMQAPEGKFHLANRGGYNSNRPDSDPFVIDDLDTLMDVIDSVNDIVTPERVRDETPEMKSLRQKIYDQLTSPTLGDIALRALKFEGKLHKPEIMGHPMSIHALSQALGGAGALGGLEKNDPMKNMHAVQLLIKTDQEGQYGIFDVQGDPRDPNTKVTVNPLPGHDAEVGNARGFVSRSQYQDRMPGRSKFESAQEQWAGYLQLMENSRL